MDIEAIQRVRQARTIQNDFWRERGNENIRDREIESTEALRNIYFVQPLDIDKLIEYRELMLRNADITIQMRRMEWYVVHMLLGLELGGEPETVFDSFELSFMHDEEVEDEDFNVNKMASDQLSFLNNTNREEEADVLFLQYVNGEEDPRDFMTDSYAKDILQVYQGVLSVYRDKETLSSLIRERIRKFYLPEEDRIQLDYFYDLFEKVTFTSDRIKDNVGSFWSIDKLFERSKED